MQKELVQDYLLKSGMSKAQSETISRILGETATKHDVQRLGQRMDAKFDLARTDIDGKFATLRAEMNALRLEMRADMQMLKSELTWRFLAGIAFFATVMTILDAFVD